MITLLFLTFKIISILVAPTKLGYEFLGWTLNGEVVETIAKGTTGDLEMNDVVVTNKMYLERDTGDIEFFRCDAKEIIINTTTGDVKGSLLSDKLFDITTNTGDKHIPSSKGEDICKITTDTGDIYINIV